MDGHCRKTAVCRLKFPQTIPAEHLVLRDDALPKEHREAPDRVLPVLLHDEGAPCQKSPSSDARWVMERPWSLRRPHPLKLCRLGLVIRAPRRSLPIYAELELQPSAQAKVSYRAEWPPGRCGAPRSPKTGSSRRMALVELQLFGYSKICAGESADRARLRVPSNPSKWQSSRPACAWHTQPHSTLPSSAEWREAAQLSGARQACARAHSRRCSWSDPRKSNARVTRPDNTRKRFTFHCSLLRGGRGLLVRPARAWTNLANDDASILEPTEIQSDETLLWGRRLHCCPIRHATECPRAPYSCRGRFRVLPRPWSMGPWRNGMRGRGFVTPIPLVLVSETSNWW